MGKFNLSEAAKDILTGNVSGKQSGQDKPSKLHGDVAYGTQEVGDIGTEVLKTTDSAPDATKGTPTATAPGATPPVGSEPMKKLKGQPGQSGSVEQPEGKTGKNQMPLNKGSVGVQQYEETEFEDEEIVAEEEESKEHDEHLNEDETLKAIAKKHGMEYHPGTYGANMSHAKKGFVNINRYGEWSHHKQGSSISGRGHGSSTAHGDSSDKFKGLDKHLGTLNEESSAKMERKEAMKEKMKSKMKEDMDALMSGENLSEEFVSKATTIFEAAVIARAEMVIEEAEAELMEQFEEAVESIKEDLAAKVDDYLNYMVEEWIKENQIAIETGLRSEIVEDFITGLKGLFEQHYIDIPEEKVNVVEGLTSKVEELEDALNEQINRAVEMNKELSEHKKNEAIYTACEGLTQTQVEKMKSLAEGVEFTTEEEFNGKLETLKESYFKSPVKSADNSALDDEVQIEEESKKPSGQGDALIEQYARTISQTLK